jgi:hypothetical protein
MENRQIRLLVAISVIFSTGGCALGPTPKPILPATPSSSVQTRLTPADQTQRAGARTPPRVTMSPLQSPLPSSPQAAPIQKSEDVPRIKVAPSRTTPAATESRTVDGLQGAFESLTPPSITKDIPSPPATAALRSGLVSGDSETTTVTSSSRPEPDRPVMQVVLPPPRESIAADLPTRESIQSTEVRTQNTAQVSANQCWGQAALLPTPKKKVTQLVTEEARTRYKVSQAKLRNEKLPVVVKEAAQSYKLQQPQFVEVTESIKVQEAYTRLRVEPAEYKTEEKDVLVESARVGLRPCSAVGERASKSASTPQKGAQCSFEIPAKYQRIKLQTLVKPEVVREEVVPAVYRNITKMVVAEPAKLIPVEIPEATVELPVASVEVQPVATPVPVQAVTVKVDVTEYESKFPQLTWARVVCDKDLSPDLIQSLQKGLQREGWMRSTPDGKLGPQTLQAAKEFQSSKGIESDFITYQLLEMLGIQISPSK